MKDEPDSWPSAAYVLFILHPSAFILSIAEHRMSAFHDCKQVEAESLRQLTPLIERRAFRGRYVTTAKGRLAAELQRKYGDLLMNRPNGDVCAVEIKAEREEKFGNFFFEEWSNRSRETPGWMRTLDVDWLLYHFLRDARGPGPLPGSNSRSIGILYCIPFPQLKEWAYTRPSRTRREVPGRVHDYELRRQTKYDQLNDTWGYAVNIWEFTSEVKCDLYLRVHGQWIPDVEHAKRNAERFVG
jgi:hypothetical protein